MLAAAISSIAFGACTSPPPIVEVEPLRCEVPSLDGILEYAHVLEAQLVKPTSTSCIAGESLLYMPTREALEAIRRGQLDPAEAELHPFCLDELDAMLAGYERSCRAIAAGGADGS